MHHERVARDLTHSQRELLIAHVDGSHDVTVPVKVSEQAQARNGLLARKLIRPDRKDRPTRTIITDDGREVLGFVLADYAEALLRAGYTGLASPVGTPPRPMAIGARLTELMSAD